MEKVSQDFAILLTRELSRLDDAILELWKGAGALHLSRDAN
jgi:hypothetical protein